MPLYRITTKSSMTTAGYHFEPGMSVDVSSQYLMSSVCSMIADQVNNAFLSKYGIDLKKMNCLHPGFLKLERL